MLRFSAILLGLLATAGCPATGGQPRPRLVATTAAVGPRATAAALPSYAPLPADHQLPTYHSNTLPGGLSCLIRLRQLGIPHRHLATLRGVNTPVRLTGPIGPLKLVPMGRRSMAGDCRLLLALHRATPYLTALGVTELHFSNAYSYRMMGRGRLSRHAMGLAIDVHRLRVNGKLLTLLDDYQRGLGRDAACAPDAPSLNRIGCVLKERGLFDRVLTPDTNHAHRNHFHLAILSLHRRRFVPRSTPAAAEPD